MKHFIVVISLILLLPLTALAIDPLTSVRQDIAKFGIQDAIDMSIPISFLFIPQIMEIEKQGIQPFNTCKVFSDPLTPEKLGITYEQYGIIDTVKEKYLQGLYGSYSSINYIANEEEIIEYANCLVKYSVIIAQAQLNLYNNLTKLGQVIRKRVKGNIELEKFKGIIRKTLIDTVNTDKYSPQIQNMVNKINITGPCKFAGNTNIMCRAYLLKLQPPQELSMQNFTIFGSNFMGIGGNIKITKTAGSENTLFELQPVKGSK